MGVEQRAAEAVKVPSGALKRRPMSARLRSRLKRLIPRAVAIQRLRESARPVVLLTFDDGPHPEFTPAVLDRLERYGARAVFFVVGRRARREHELLDRIRSAGHVIGNHSHLHRDRYIVTSGPQASFLSYYRDCVRCQTVIERLTGASPTLFRPPGGRLMPASLLTPRLLGMRSVLWSKEVKDWTFDCREDARAGAAELLRVIAPRDIVLLHDFNPHVVDLLDTLLPGLRDRGYDLAAGVDLL
jgi:peptidoglycan/xylan/chitin deacetylase (PgdA/CDA1 family)